MIVYKMTAEEMAVDKMTFGEMTKETPRIETQPDSHFNLQTTHLPKTSGQVVSPENDCRQNVIPSKINTAFLSHQREFIAMNMSKEKRTK